LNTIDIYTDGGCHGISGMGGWAAMIYDGPRPVEISGYETDATNQKMELRAAIEGLGYLEQPSQVRLYSDSAYVINGMKQRWYLKWEQNGWKTANKKPVKNADLWKELVEVSRFHRVTWMKVRGHAGIPANERCDALVRLEMARGLG
jgi:ribonuclease HI